MNNEQTKMMREIATEFVVKTTASENEKSCGLSVEATALSLLWQVVDPTPNLSAKDLAFKMLECLIGRHEAKTAVALAEGLEFFQTPQDSDF